MKSKLKSKIICTICPKVIWNIRWRTLSKTFGVSSIDGRHPCVISSYEKTCWKCIEQWWIFGFKASNIGRNFETTITAKFEQITENVESVTTIRTVWSSQSKIPPLRVRVSAFHRLIESKIHLKTLCVQRTKASSIKTENSKRIWQIIFEWFINEIAQKEWNSEWRPKYFTIK